MLCDFSYKDKDAKKEDVPTFFMQGAEVTSTAFVCALVLKITTKEEWSQGSCK